VPTLRVSHSRQPQALRACSGSLGFGNATSVEVGWI